MDWEAHDDFFAYSEVSTIIKPKIKKYRVPTPLFYKLFSDYYKVKKVNCSQIMKEANMFFYKNPRTAMSRLNNKLKALENK